MKTLDEQITWLQRELQKHTPSDWADLGAYGLVIVFDDPSHQQIAIPTLSQWAQRDLFPFRAPHHSVGNAGLKGELLRANGGLLMLDDFGSFSETALGVLRNRILSGDLTTVVGLDTIQLADLSDMKRIAANAEALGLVVLNESGDVLFAPTGFASAPAPSSVSQEDIDVLNQHRRSLGMGKIDLSAGWSDEELRDMAENIRKHGRTHNPAQASLKRKLMR
jgi:hypothetical protein